MIYLYINYPEPHFTIHTNTCCEEIRKRQKSGQRILKIGHHNLAIELLKFDQEYQFESTPPKMICGSR